MYLSSPFPRVHSWGVTFLHSVTLLPLWYSFTFMWWLPDGVKYLPGLVMFALFGYCANRTLSVNLVFAFCYGAPWAFSGFSQTAPTGCQ